MTLIKLLVFLHVTGAIVWVGAVMTLRLLHCRAEHQAGSESLKEVLRMTDWLSPRLFIPASVVTLLAGISLVIVSTKVTLEQPWIILGLIGLAAAGAAGGGLVGPTSHKALVLLEQNDTSGTETSAILRKLRLYATIEIIILLLVVLDMVVKPH